MNNFELVLGIDGTLITQSNFNDRDIYQLEAVKLNVKKGEEYIKFDIIETKWLT